MENELLSMRMLAMLETAQKIKDQLNSGEATLILRVGDEYIVRRLDNVGIYNDDSLPMDLRERFGLLKLIDVDKQIDDVGVRIADDVFVIGGLNGK